MFRFATTALKQFSGDLSQWPQYCTHLKQVRWAPVAVLLYTLQTVCITRIMGHGWQPSGQRCVLPHPTPSHPSLPPWPRQQVAGLKEAEPDLAAAVESALATIAANGAAASAVADAAKSVEVRSGPSAGAAAAFTPPKSREGNAAGFPTAPLPSTPSNPNMLFSTINAETLESSAQNVSFPVPEDKVGGTAGSGRWGWGVQHWTGQRGGCS